MFTRSFKRIFVDAAGAPRTFVMTLKKININKQFPFGNMFENILAENHQYLLHLLPARHEVDISATVRRTHCNLMMDLRVITYDAYEDNMLEISGIWIVAMEH